MHFEILNYFEVKNIEQALKMYCGKSRIRPHEVVQKCFCEKYCLVAICILSLQLSVKSVCCITSMQLCIIILSDLRNCTISRSRKLLLLQIHKLQFCELTLLIEVQVTHQQNEASYQRKNKQWKRQRFGK